MRVVHAAKFYPPVRGGMETVVGDLCDGTAGDWDVEVVAANESRPTIHERVSDVAVVRAGALGTGSVGADLSVAAARISGATVRTAWCCTSPIRLPEPRCCFEPPRRAWSSGITAICCGRGGRRRPTAGSCSARCTRRADCVIVSSPALAAQSTLVQCARHVAVIPFGIDAQRYRRADPARMAESRPNRQRIARTAPLVRRPPCVLQRAARCCSMRCAIGRGR